jgi:2-methylcitrate dehydratase PrpD
VRRADVQTLMPRVGMVIHPEQATRDRLPTRFSEVTIRLRDGRQLRRRVQQAKGQPRNPLTDAELAVKFRDCGPARFPPSGWGLSWPTSRGSRRWAM